MRLAAPEAAWEFIEPGLREVLRRTKEPWNPEDVRRQLVTGQASLWVCDDGFVVLQKLREEFSCKPYLYVWVMWFKPGKGRAVRAEVEAWLSEVALQHVGDARAVKFSSPRIGWKALEPDWEIERIIWRRKNG